MESFIDSVVQQFGPFPLVGKCLFFLVLRDGFNDIISAALPAKLSAERMSAPTALACNSLGPVIIKHPQIHVIRYEKMLLVKQQSLTQCGLGAFKAPPFLLSPSAAIHPKFEKGRTHLPEIVIHPVKTLAVGHVFNVNQEFFQMIKTGDGYLWRGWKGKLTPCNRGDNAVKPSGSALGQSTSSGGKSIYSWCKLICCSRYFGSCREQVGNHQVGTPVEVEGSPEWWEIEDGDEDEDGVGDGSDDSEYGSDDESIDSDEESEEEEEEVEEAGVGYVSDESEYSSDQVSTDSDGESEEEESDDDEKEGREEEGEEREEGEGEE
ncbi:hypothetical protein L873DRAFT_1789756 [Choiromyces venosus 120613-1]|uniref:Uncharacterized protein n=1 Tax=Choiromyces venosus 120613-1 TaxID=1336337 RepID=A0A3N4JQP1_9PEZI|nr:hypothetical protein L873DRAFT_1789756 [Choiromyces venosus 120613-1]